MRNPWFKSSVLQVHLCFNRLITRLQSGMMPLAWHAEQWLDSGCDFLNASLLKRMPCLQST